MPVNRLNQVLPWLSGLKGHTNLFQIFGRDLDLASPAPTFPSLKVWEEGDNIRVEALVPGMDMKDLEITVSNSNEVTIKGEQTVEKVEEKGTWHRREREHGKFSRTLRLLFPIAGDKVEASLEHGVLKIMLPRHEAAKGRRIPVRIN
ncbi:MAG: Hsp20/alpha crystallin family protein [Gemmataceae bacterium]|nr:Hsp20/alpha crystallin family protein [Gemmataceae bacterium]